MPFLLETERLALRQFHEEDLEAFLAYRNEPQVAKYQSWDIPYPREKAVKFIEEMKGKSHAVTDDWFQAAIVLKAGGEAIGDCAYIVKSEGNQSVIGYSLASKYWGKGYAAEALRRLLGYLFEERGVHRVIADTDAENVASWKTLERLGFRREAHFVESLWFKGNWASEYHYAMLEREWKLLKSG
ncbi:MAG: GNAT family N-acetyltransferase [Chloroflexi bacterium]|nr:GNAT family N-acetyltransferase [Chloroflexota bacterium]